MSPELNVKQLLFKPSRQFVGQYTSENSGHAEQDLRLRTFSSTMGQMTERAALNILSEKVKPNIDDNERESIFNSVRDPLRFLVKQIPVPTKIITPPNTGNPPLDESRSIKHRKATFSHKLLYPSYFKMAQDRDWMSRFEALTVEADHEFGTAFISKYNELELRTNVPGMLPHEDFSEFRYLVDGVLMAWHFYFDKDTRKTLSQFGRFVRDVDLETTQVDGLFINPLFNPANFDSNGRNGKDLLQKIARKPGMDRFSETVPWVVDCSIFEMKSQFLARDVAQHPQRKTPRSWHIAQVVGSMHNILHNHQIGLAPKYMVFLYLGSLQPNVVHIIKPDSFYWQNLADRVEHAILYDLGGAQNEEELRSSLSKFLDFTTLLASELQVLETRDDKVNKLKGEIKNVKAITMKKFKQPKPSSMTQMVIGEKIVKLAKKRIERKKATKQKKKDNEKIRQQNIRDLERVFNDMDMNIEAGFDDCREELETTVDVFNNMEPGKRVPWPEK